MKRILLNPMYALYKIFSFPFIVYSMNRKLRKYDGDYEPLVEYNLMKMLRYSILNVKAYKNIIIDNELTAIENLKKFPVLVRKDLQEHRSDYLSNKYIASIEFNTSGSSGDPLYFFRSAVASAVDDAHQLFSYENMGYKSGDRIIIFNGYEPDKNSLNKHKFWKRKSFIRELPFGSVQFSSNYISKSNFYYYFNAISKIKPAIIKGYPSSIYMFFKLVEQHGISFDFEIKGIQLSSENIFDYQVKLIEEISGSKVYKQYGHTECAMFAESSDNNYNFSPFYGYLEVLSDDGEQVKVGTTGRITVTAFHSYKQPFIRYDTGDYGKYMGIINGHQIVESIAGREQDYFISLSGLKVPITSIISGSHLSINKYVTCWKIKQSEPGCLDIITLESENVPLSCYDEITLKFKSYATINYYAVEKINRSKSGKYKFFESEICCDKSV